MSNDRTKILNMLAEGKISVDEAEKLLGALGEEPVSADAPVKSGKKGSPKYLRVVVDSIDEASGKPEKVNIRVPIQLLRAGIKIKSILPGHASDKVHGALHDKGMDFDFNNMNPESIDELINALSELTVDVDSDNDKVRIFCE